MTKRLEWDKSKKNLTFEQWKKNIWRYDSGYRVVENDRSIRVIRLAGEKCNPKNIIEVVRKAWKVFCNDLERGSLVFMEGNVDQDKYDPGSQYLFQEGNASPYRVSCAIRFRERVTMD